VKSLASSVHNQSEVCLAEGIEEAQVGERLPGGAEVGRGAADGLDIVEQDPARRYSGTQRLDYDQAPLRTRPADTVIHERRSCPGGHSPPDTAVCGVNPPKHCTFRHRRANLIGVTIAFRAPLPILPPLLVSGTSWAGRTEGSALSYLTWFGAGRPGLVWPVRCPVER
jgi:hypothetical protein